MPATRTRTSRLLGAVLFIALFAVGNIAARSFFAQSDEARAAELAEALATLASRENPAEPRPIEPGMSLLAVAAEAKTLTYSIAVGPEHETTIRLGGFERDRIIRDKLCATDFKSLVSAGATVVYTYVSAATRQPLAETKIAYCI
jgi:hypothetical protein